MAPAGAVGSGLDTAIWTGPGGTFDTLKRPSAPIAAE
jgi:hypothetical protein